LASFFAYLCFMLDTILIDDAQIAKAFLIDEKVYEFSGEICSNYESPDITFSSIFLKQSSGYQINLVARIEELVMNFGREVNLRYWITDKKVSAKELIDYTVLLQCGEIDVSRAATPYSYSEYTSGIDYDINLKIGGHDLYKELSDKYGKYLYIIISFKNQESLFLD